MLAFVPGLGSRERGAIGTRLAQLSDLHVDPRVDNAYLLRSLDCVRESSPEITLFRLERA